MASILPQCSWCGGELKENELRKSKEEILQRWEKDKKDNEYQKNLDEHGKEIRKDFESFCAARSWTDSPPPEPSQVAPSTRGGGRSLRTRAVGSSFVCF